MSTFVSLTFHISRIIMMTFKKETEQTYRITLGEVTRLLTENYHHHINKVCLFISMFIWVRVCVLYTKILIIVLR